MDPIREFRTLVPLAFPFSFGLGIHWKPCEWCILWLCARRQPCQKRRLLQILVEHLRYYATLLQHLQERTFKSFMETPCTMLTSLKDTVLDDIACNLLVGSVAVNEFILVRVIGNGAIVLWFFTCYYSLCCSWTDTHERNVRVSCHLDVEHIRDVNMRVHTFRFHGALAEPLPPCRYHLCFHKRVSFCSENRWHLFQKYLNCYFGSIS